MCIRRFHKMSNNCGGSGNGSGSGCNTIVNPVTGAIRGTHPIKIKVKVKTKAEAKTEATLPEVAAPPTQPLPTPFEVTKKATGTNAVETAKEVLAAQDKNKRRIATGNVPDLCTECAEILGNFMIPHKPAACPLRNASYCSYCSRYGHISSECGAAPPPWANDVCYIEQLVPSGDLAKFGIKSRTSIHGDVVCKIPKSDEPIPNSLGTIELRDNDKEIKAWLRGRGVNTTENYRRNREMLQQYADRQGKVVVFLP